MANLQPPPAVAAPSRRGSIPGRKGPGMDNKLVSEAFECCKGQNCDLHSGGSRSVLNKGPVTSWTSIKTMPKEISQYAIDFPTFTDVKAKDIERHSIDEKLDPFQRAMVCLKSEEPSEKIYVASKFDAYVRENMTRTFNDIFPLLVEELKKSTNPDLHSTAAHTMTLACRNLYGKNPKQAKELLQLIFQHVDSEDVSVSEAWTRSVNELMETMSPKELEKEFSPAIMEKAKNMKSVNARKAACILLTKLMAKGPPELGTQLMPMIRPLCQDVSPIVRGTICLQLPAIYQRQIHKDELLLNLSILAKDTDARVKCCLICSISKIIQLPDMKFFFADTVPLIKRTVKEAYLAGHIDLLQEFSFSMGEIAKTLSDAGVLDGNNKLWFLDAFLHLSRYGLPAPTGTSTEMPTGFLNFRANTDYSRRHSLVESLVGTGPTKGAVTTPDATTRGWICRMNAAKGFAYFAKFAKPLVEFKSGLHPLIVDLSHDSNPQVRAAMAGNIWPIMEILGSTGHVLSGEFLYALADDDMGVIDAIVPNMSSILQTLVQGKVLSPEVQTAGQVEVIGAIMFCEERLHNTNNWRTHSSLLSQMSVLPYCVTGDYLFVNVMPNLFHRLVHLKQLPSRLAAADAIISFLRNCRRAGQREDIRKKIKESFAEGRSVQDRMLYLFMSKMIIDNFSRKYFRDHFFEQTLHLADDNVPNVRMKVVGLMPEMKGTLKSSDNDNLLKKLEEVVNRIRISETDRDVQNAIQDAIVEMKRIGVVFDKEKVMTLAAKKNQKTKEDAEDEAKEKEEAFIESLEKTLPEIRPKQLDKGRKGNADATLIVPPQPAPKNSTSSPKKPPAPAPTLTTQPSISPSENQSLAPDTKKKMNLDIDEATRLRRRTLVPTQVAQINRGGKK